MAAHHHLCADAKIGVDAILNALGDIKGCSSGGHEWRDELAAQQKAAEYPDALPFQVAPDVIDPRQMIKALDQKLPKDWFMVNSSGHCSYYAAHMTGRSADAFLTIREFGAIGNGLSYAIGVAAARPETQVVLIDGDGGFLMHAKELETIKRHGIKLLMIVMNDAAYGSEIHKLRVDGHDETGAAFGQPDLASVARGFGLGGVSFTNLEELDAAFEDFVSGEKRHYGISISRSNCFASNASSDGSKKILFCTIIGKIYSCEELRSVGSETITPSLISSDISSFSIPQIVVSTLHYVRNGVP